MLDRFKLAKKILTNHSNGDTIVINRYPIVTMKEDQIEFLKKITPTRAYQAVVDQLENAILSGELKPGEKLPSERELIDVFATSRRTLREAFRVLEQKGLISIKIGSKGGTFVANQVDEKLVETLTLFVRSENVPQDDLAEFRALTEGAVVELLARRADEAVFALIEDAIVAIESLMDHGPIDKQQFVEAEMALHQLLADRCGNAMYPPILKTTYDLLLRDAFMMDHIDKTYVQNAMADWRELLNALRCGTAREAGELMKIHILGFAQN